MWYSSVLITGKFTLSMYLRLEKMLVARTKPYLQHLTSNDDLITNYEAIWAGFVALALEKNRRATPFVAQARG
jgi:hypothetical protein